MPTLDLWRWRLRDSATGRVPASYERREVPDVPRPPSTGDYMGPV